MTINIFCVTVAPAGLNKGEVAQGRQPALEGLGPTCASSSRTMHWRLPWGSSFFAPGPPPFPHKKCLSIYHNLSPLPEREERAGNIERNETFF